MRVDMDQDQLYRDLAASQSDEDRARAWHAFVQRGSADGDVQRLRALCGASDPAAVIERLNEDAPARAKQMVIALGLQEPHPPK